MTFVLIAVRAERFLFVWRLLPSLSQRVNVVEGIWKISAFQALFFPFVRTCISISQELGFFASKYLSKQGETSAESKVAYFSLFRCVYVKKNRLKGSVSTAARHARSN